VTVLVEAYGKGVLTLTDQFNFH